MATNSFVLTYDSLTQSVLQYLERSDPAVVAFIPTAITMAEFEIAQNIKTLGQMEVADSTMTPGNPIIAKPARWRKTVSMTVTTPIGKQPVYLRKLEYLNNYWPNVTATDTPLFYADYDADHWFIAPTPSSAFPFEALCYTRLQPLDSANQTNWLTQNAPNAMLFGTLKQTAPFLKDDARLAVWSGLFDAALAALKTEDQLRIGDRQAIAQDS
ncbi:hypothetical protein UFOVP56_5 [uncultured Caudovirales phage]|uniref:Uncharacterized protein n=1 Tax=uncultured Caudovirales phage TaxID=2100421 RepID=A0A6J5T9B5_9CAUD|nr:hypothetical protein UFOVP56_5 [uncultured Caudovirales phage]